MGIHHWSRWLTLAALAGAPRAAAQTDSLVVRAAAVLDGRGGSHGPTDIVIRGSRIVQLRTPSGTPTYNLGSLTVLPGGIDTHVHLTNHFDANGRAHGSQEAPEGLQETVLYGMENAWATLQSGITTVQSLGAAVDRDLRDAINRGGVPGPRILTSLE